MFRNQERSLSPHRLTTIILATLLLFEFFPAPIAGDELVWTQSGSMRFGRAHHTATLLLSGEVLVAGNHDGSIYETEVYDPETELWSDSGALNFARSEHTATLLPSGEVLVAGGWSVHTSGELSSAEIYDPHLGTWRTTGDLQVARRGHTANLLYDGRVLVIGGWNEETGGLASAEFYDPATGVWSLADEEMTAPRQDHTATLTASGRILVVGDSPSNEPELFDPLSQQWSQGREVENFRNHTSTLLPSGMILVVGKVEGQNPVYLYDPLEDQWDDFDAGSSLARENHSSLLLPSGHVLIAGGIDEKILKSTLIYEPNDDKESFVQPVGDFIDPRSDFTLTLLASGDVLAVGGWTSGTNGSSSTTERMRRISPSWSLTADLNERRLHETATKLQTGGVLVVGGGSNTAEIYDPSTDDEWRRVESRLEEDISQHTANLLPSGDVLIVGGLDGSQALSTASRFNTSTEQWEAAGELSFARSSHTATVLPSGHVLVVGGSDGSHAMRSTEIFLGSEEWISGADLINARKEHSAHLLPSGEVLIIGGKNESGTLRETEICDIDCGEWRTGTPMSIERRLHASVALLDGRILVAGGIDHSDRELSEVEIYDPADDSWESVSPMKEARSNAAALLLDSGEILIVGDNLSPSKAEIFDPVTEEWRIIAQPSLYRWSSLTLLDSGAVLIAGDNRRYAEILPWNGSPERPRPTLLSTPTNIRFGQSFDLVGHFLTDSEGDSGTDQSSAGAYPLVRLQAQDGSQKALISDPIESFQQDPMILTFNKIPSDLEPGDYNLRVTVGGISSKPHSVTLECSIAVTAQPQDHVLQIIGEDAVFSIEAQGERSIQWQRNGVDIPGAVENSLTVAGITLADIGTRFRAVIANDCTSTESEAATIRLEDVQTPTTSVISPRGGEYWSLSTEGESPQKELIVWSIEDDTFPCRVEVALLYSNDGGDSYLPAPEDGALPAVFDAGENCTWPGIETNHLVYPVPTLFPSSSPGSLYKIQLIATDLGGNSVETRSENPFQIVESDNTDIRTLILAHSGRMQQLFDLSSAEAAELIDKLHELANHPRVAGRVIDLSTATDLTHLYQVWDQGNGVDANPVLFDPGGVHQILLDLLELYPEVEYLVLAGDDRIVPMARLEDRTSLYPEPRYVNQEGNLTDISTVGAAIRAGFYLTDDPLATRYPTTSDEIDGAIFLPDLAVGRLVETPEEIIHTINVFIGTGGVLDLGSLPGRKAQVTGYDFLEDSAQRIRQDWEDAFHPSDVGELIGSNWDDFDLLDHLCGFGSSSYGIVNLNGHASHYAEGAPLSTGLETRRMIAAHACGESTPLDLSGRVVYAVGCHGGLTVPGSDFDDADRSLDLPQTFLSLGALAYVANTGFGWGLRRGVGYGERLVEIMSQELLTAETIAIGDAIQRTKLRYFEESAHFDAYDEKTVHQWALFGLPMYSVSTGVAAAAVPDENPPIGVRTEIFHADANSDLPPHLTRLDASFDFNADGVYVKYDSLGQEISGPGCDDSSGCYYALNGLSTAQTDLPIQPHFVYDSRLSGTSQHGVLWLGGTFEQEGDWTPIIAELISNGGDNHDPGSTPRRLNRGPIDRRATPGQDPTECRPSDLEVNNVVAVTGSVLDSSSSGDFDTLQIMRDLSLEVFYFNNPIDPSQNCDRRGPLFHGRSSDYHAVSSSRIDWNIPVEDEAGVWRVVILINDGILDDENHGSWQAIELESDGETGSIENFTGRYFFPDDVDEVTYFVQAVDRRGNVSALEYETVDLPDSAVEKKIFEPIVVRRASGEIDLAIVTDDLNDPVDAGSSLIYSLNIRNHGPDVASDLKVNATMPEGAILLSASGDGWVCDFLDTAFECGRSEQVYGAPSQIVLAAIAPTDGGVAVLTPCVSGHEFDPDSGNNCEAEETVVYDDTTTDLKIVKSDGGAVAVGGAPLTYTISVTNNGPIDLFGATVVDEFPDEISNVVWTCVSSAGSSCGGSGFGDINDMIDLAVEGVVLYEATGLVDPEVQAPISNTADIEVPEGFTDIRPIDNVSTVSTPVSRIFSDGFETGDFSSWTNATPEH